MTSIPPSTAAALAATGDGPPAAGDGLHRRGYAGHGPDTGQDPGAYCTHCSHLANDYVPWPCPSHVTLMAVFADLDRAVAERDLARDCAVALEQQVARVEKLIDPATQMAQPLYGSRYFDEADIRRALDPEATP